jgi:hypothetical protein
MLWVAPPSHHSSPWPVDPLVTENGGFTVAFWLYPCNIDDVDKGPHMLRSLTPLELQWEQQQRDDKARKSLVQLQLMKSFAFGLVLIVATVGIASMLATVFGVHLVRP